MKLSDVNDFDLYLTSKALEDDKIQEFLKNFSKIFYTTIEKYRELLAMNHSMNATRAFYVHLIRDLHQEYTQFIEQNGIKVRYLENQNSVPKFLNTNKLKKFLILISD